MNTSGEILSFLGLLDEAGTDLDLVYHFVDDYARDDPKALRILDAAEVKTVQDFRAVVSKIVRARQEPSRELSEEMIRIILGILSDEALNECFTRLELQMIPEIVRRWKNLRAVQLVLLPTKPEVADYLRQATMCYLHGLPTAAAILCRTVLQFALEEAIPNVGGVRLGEVDRRDWLMKLIHLASSTKTLPVELVTIAHRIREVGNDAVHSGVCAEARALATIKDTGEVLAHIYRTPRKGR